MTDSFSSDLGLFTLRRVDERSWSHVRGTAVIGDVFDDSACGMDITAGHIAAVCGLHQPLSPGKCYALFAFDAVPPFAQCNDDAIAQIKNLLITGSFDDGVNIRQVCFDFLEKPPVCVKFLEPHDSSDPLRLVVFDTDGNLFLWEWDQDKFIWFPNGMIPKAFPFPVDSFNAHQLAYDSQNKTLCWASSQGHIIVQQLLVTVEDKLTLKCSVVFGSEVHMDLSGHESCIATPRGVWLVDSNSVSFLPFSSPSLDKVAVLSKASLAHLADPQYCLMPKICAVHPFSHELLVVDVQGRIAVFSVEDDKYPPNEFTVSSNAVLKIRASYAGTLHYPSGMKPTQIRHITVARHVIAFLTPGEVEGDGYGDKEFVCTCFDISSGILMGSTLIPYTAKGLPQFWGPSEGDIASRFGVWTPEYFGVLQYPSPMSYAQALVSVATNSSTPQEMRDEAALSAVAVCEDWHLDRWVARFAFELLLKNSGMAPDTVEELSKALAQHLQNPALICGLISGKNMNDLLERELTRFLALYNGENSDADKQTAYELHTPLNNKIVDQLADYLEVLRMEKRGVNDPSYDSLFQVARDSTLFMDNVSSQTILTLDWQTLMTFVRQDPRQCSDLICGSVGLDTKLLEQLAASSDTEFSAELELDPILFTTLRSAQQPNNVNQSTGGPLTTSTSSSNLSALVRSVSPSSSSVAGTSPSAPVTGPVNPTVLELLTGALFSDRPHLLPALVTALVSSNLSPLMDAVSIDENERRTYAFRMVANKVLKALPIMACIDEPKFSEKLLSPSLRKEQIVALSKLLEMKSKPLNAILLLLRNDLWDEALALLSRSTTKTTEIVHAQLFEAVLHEALRKKKTTVFDSIWPFLPKTMSPLDLAHIISSYSTSDRVAQPLESDAAFTVGMFKTAFLRLMQAQSSSS